LLLTIQNRLEFFFAGWNHNSIFANKDQGNCKILKRVVYRGLTKI
jgi:hypothetical protein